MRLAIVIPTLNEAATIEAMLRALTPLRQRGVSVIVADGGSSDDTVKRAVPLADRVVDDAAVPTEPASVEINDIPRLRRVRLQALDNVAVASLRYEADILTIGLVGHP